jgi:hypothetical protein
MVLSGGDELHVLHYKSSFSYFFLIVHKTISYTIHITVCSIDMPFLGESILQHGKIDSALARQT